MPIVLDPHLYTRARRTVDKQYTKPSAYKSGAIVREYKRLGGRYKEDGNELSLARWFKEKW